MKNVSDSIKVLKEKKMNIEIPDEELNATSHNHFISNELLNDNRSHSEKAMNHWRSYLDGYTGLVTIPSDNTKGYDRINLQIKHQFTINKQKTNALKKLSVDIGVSVNILIQTIWAIILAKYNNRDDVVFGVVVPAGSPEIENVEKISGLFFNTVPVYIKTGKYENFREMAEHVQKEELENSKYNFSSLTDIQSYCYQNNPLVSNIIIFDNYLWNVAFQEKETLSLEAIEYFKQENYDFKILVQSRDVLYFEFLYNPEKYSTELIGRITSHITTTIEEVILNSYRPIKDINIIPEFEKKCLLDKFNDTLKEFPQDKTMVDLFEDQVKMTPDNIAIIFEDEKLTYAKLNKEANKVANYLRKFCSIQPEELIGVLLSRSEKVIIALLGILKAGGVYVPIDTEYPEERIQYMLNDSKPKAIIIDKVYPDLAVEKTIHISEILNSEIEINNPHKTIKPDNLAYVIYTSGSTGKPKGSMLEHSGFVNMILDQIRFMGIVETDRALLFASTSFDASMSEIFLPLYSGCTLVIASDAVKKDITQFHNLIIKNDITVATLPPTYLKILDFQVIKNLRVLITMGEKPNQTDVKKYHKVVKYYNAYGPTEATVYITYYLMEAAIDSTPEILLGKPIANTRIYILDRNNALMPIGIPGELCVAGIGLSRGYLNKTELTNEKFTENPFISGERIYRTGDASLWHSDGNLECLGRIDNQVKIRGFRIEPGEIESILIQHKNIDSAVVMAHEDIDGNKNLVAYYISKNDILLEECRTILGKHLPEYMIPAFFIRLECFPLTPNGKVDRKELLKLHENCKKDIEYIAPRNSTENKIADIWKQVTGVSRNIGINDNFFELGGDSIKAIQIMSRMYQQGLIGDISSLFEYPRIREFSLTVNKKNTIQDQAIEKSTQTKKNLLDFTLKGITNSEYQKLLLDNRIEENNVQDIYNLTPLQAGFLFHTMKDNISHSYFEQILLDINGFLDVKLFKHCWQQIMECHESLRTMFVSDFRIPVQVVLKRRPLDFTILDLRNEENKQDCISKIRISDKQDSFDLNKDSLFRIKILWFGSERYTVLLSFHHIILDGWSISILISEFLKNYTNADKASKISPYIPPSYSRFISWLNIKEKKISLKYWKSYLSGYKPLSTILQVGEVSYKGEDQQLQYNFKFDKVKTESLKKLSNEMGVSLNTLIKTAWGVLLSKYNNSDDVVFANTVSVRPQEIPDIEKMTGLLINTIPVRIKFNKEDSFKDTVLKIQQEALENMAYHYSSLADIQSYCYAGNTLLDHIFVFENYPIVDYLKKPGPVSELLSIEKIENFEQIHYDFGIAIFPGKSLHFRFYYNPHKYNHDLMQRIEAHLTTTVNAIIANENQLIKDICIIPRDEKHLILNVFNNTNKDYPADKTIVDIFEEQIEKTPDNTAIVFEDKTLTYKELNKEANKLAHYLQKQGVRPESLVGVYIDRSIEMIVSILGILKAGGAYVPIDPSYPKERIAYIIEDSDCELILSLELLKTDLQRYSDKIIYLDRDWKIIEAESWENVNAKIQNNNLAYVIYTSGSTGLPKGVMVEHSGLNNLQLEQGLAFNIAEDDTILQFASLSFDAFVSELFMALSKGAKLVLCKKESIYNVDKLTKLINNQNVNTITLPPTMLSLLDPESITLKTLISAGEMCSSELVKKWAGHVNFYNAYGPTENTVCTTIYKCNINDNISPSIGKAIGNHTIYILDENLHIVPIGVPGELCIGGIGLARGYLNKPELTREKFVDNPFLPGKRMYKTGDLAQWLPDGNIDFLGRIDTQVKVRGFRIELGEIENTLLQFNQIDAVAVIAKESHQGDKYLVAYYVAQNEIDTTKIKFHLSRSLPEYMIPSCYMMLDSMPLTPNGKVDRKALFKIDTPFKSEINYVPPQNETEQKLVGIWKDVIGIEKIGISNDFFDLGGNSITAMSVLQKINNSFNIELKIDDIFRMPEIVDLAVFINDKKLQYHSIVPETYDNNFFADFDIPDFKIIENKQKILNINLQRNITTYLFYALPLCVVLSDKNTIPWFHQHFNQIFSMNSNDQYLILNYAEPECINILNSTFMKFDDIPADKNVVEFIIDQIENNTHVEVCLDEFYLKGKTSYAKKHFVHENLLYGYNSIENKFYGISFNTNGLFDKMEYDYSSVYIAFEEAKIHYQESAPYASYRAFELMRLKENSFCYEFSTKQFVDEMREYLTSKKITREVSYIQPIIFENKGWEHRSYGLDVYDVVIEFLYRLAQGEMVIDYRAIHLLAEHKQKIHQALIYITETYSVTDKFKKMVDAYGFFSSKMHSVRIEYKKIEFDKKKSKLSYSEKMKSIASTLESLKHEDEQLVTRLCLEMSEIVKF